MLAVRLCTGLPEVRVVLLERAASRSADAVRPKTFLAAVSPLQRSYNAIWCVKPAAVQRVDSIYRRHCLYSEPPEVFVALRGS